MLLNYTETFVVAKWSNNDIHCVVSGQSGATKHHIYTQKAHPDKIHKAWNQLPLCHKLHMECHQIGLKRFSDKYPPVYEWLVKNGWEFDAVLMKWRHD